ncbi:MAG: hypothetical protein GXP55_15700 [Deltaproteobacteria bacterium]|nr:hypothetical protein [Deltaproteobacteria bacterium]
MQNAHTEQNPYTVQKAEQQAFSPGSEALRRALERELRRAAAVEQQAFQMQKEVKYLEQDFASLVREADATPEAIDALSAELDEGEDIQAAKVAFGFCGAGPDPVVARKHIIPSYALMS